MGEDRLIVLGAGGHARVVASIARAAGVHVVAFYDDDPATWGAVIDGTPVLGAIAEAMTASTRRAVIGIGDNRIRQGIATRLPLEYVTLVHPYSWVAPGVTMGAGTVLCAGTIVQPGSTIGVHAIVNTRSSVDHDATVGDFVHLALTHLAGSVTVEEGAFLGVGTTILPGVTVGAWSMVAAGGVVARDVRPGVTVFGNPARELPPKPESPAAPAVPAPPAPAAGR